MYEEEKEPEMLVEFQIKNLKMERLEKGGLIFGQGWELFYSKLEEFCGEQLQCWPSGQNSVNFDELIGKTLLVPNILHLDQSEIEKLLTYRRTLNINLVATISELDSASPLLSEGEVKQKLVYMTANFQTVLFTRCNQKLAEYLSSVLNRQPEYFTNISLLSYKVEVLDRSPAPCS